VLERRFGEQFLREAVTEAGLDVEHIRRMDGWLSKRFVIDLANIVVRRVTGLEEPPPYDHPIWQLWVEVGRQTVRPESLGPMYAVMRALGAPGPCMRQLAMLLNTESKLFHTAKLEQGYGRVVFEMRDLIPDEPDSPAICWQTRSGIGMVPTIWGLPPCEVDHPRCRFQGDEVCVYEFRFVERSILRTLSAPLSTIGGALLGAGVAAWTQWDLATAMAVGGLAGLALERTLRMRAIEAVGRDEDVGAFELLQAANLRYVELWQQTEQLRATIRSNRRLGRFVPEQVARQLTTTEDAPELGGKSADVTVLFADLEGYSQVSEALAPPEVLELLNSYFALMNDVVSTYGGSVIEYTGDGMLVVFGAPEPREDHAEAAVRCALAMHHRLRETAAAFSTETTDASELHSRVAMLRARVGVHSGEVVAGNVGVDRRMKYSVVGDTVNVAARLEQMNKDLGTRILVSGSTILRLPEELVSQSTPHGAHQVKGRKRPVDVYAFAAAERRRGLWRKEQDTDLYLKLH